MGKDLSKLEQYEECNWTPAVTYWKRKLKEQERFTEIARNAATDNYERWSQVYEENKTLREGLQNLLSDLWNVMNHVNDDDWTGSLNPDNPDAPLAVCFRQNGYRAIQELLKDMEKKMQALLPGKDTK